MKKAITSIALLAAVSAVGSVARRRFGPDLAQRGMQKCHELMDRMAEQGSAERSAQSHEGLRRRSRGQFKGNEQIFVPQRDQTARSLVSEHVGT